MTLSAPPVTVLPAAAPPGAGAAPAARAVAGIAEAAAADPVTGTVAADADSGDADSGNADSGDADSGDADAADAAVDRRWMQRALALALAAEADGEVLGEAGNGPIGAHDPSAHAEIRALRAAGLAVGNYRLPGSTLYVTLEPCPMCAGALVHARVERVVYAAPDPRTGAAGSVYDLLRDPRLNHRCRVDSGLCADDSAALLRRFFRARRPPADPPADPA